MCSGGSDEFLQNLVTITADCPLKMVDFCGRK